MHLIGPFEAFEAGFCTEFCCASFVFLSPGAVLGTPGWNVGTPRSDLGISRSTFWHGDVFGVPKNMNLR